MSEGAALVLKIDAKERSPWIEEVPLRIPARPHGGAGAMEDRGGTGAHLVGVAAKTDGAGGIGR